MTTLRHIHGIGEVTAEFADRADRLHLTMTELENIWHSVCWHYDFATVEEKSQCLTAIVRYFYERQSDKTTRFERASNPAWAREALQSM